MLKGLEPFYWFSSHLKRGVKAVVILSSLCLAVPLLIGVFGYSTMTNLYFAKTFGGAGVFMPAGTIPFFNRDVLNFEALGLVLIGFGWFQFVSMPLAGIAWKSKQYFLAFGSASLGLFGVFLGFWAGVSYQVVSQDYAARKNTVDLAAFNRLEINANKSALLTHEKAPRSASIIEAEIKQKLRRVVRVRGRATTVGKYTNNCASSEKLKRSCGEISKLETELAKSEAYAFNQNRASQDIKALKGAVTIDVNKFYAFLGSDKTLELDKSQQDLIRHTIIQTACEVGSLFLLPLILLILSTCAGGQKEPEQPEPEDASKQYFNDADMTPLSTLKDGAPDHLYLINNDKEDLKTKKFANLRRYIKEQKCAGEYYPKPFMKALNKWCVKNGLPKFHQKEVGGKWDELVGHRYSYRKDGSERTMWVVGQPKQPQLKFGGL